MREKMKKKKKKTLLKPVQFPNPLLLYFSLSWTNRKIILGSKA